MSATVTCPGCRDQAPVGRHTCPWCKFPLRQELSNREIQVITEIARGFGTKEIAERLGLSAKTIEFHRLQAVHRMGVKISPAVYPSYEIQVEMYRLGVGADKAAVLLLNVKANKLKKYKFIPTERCTKRYFSLWDIWHHETEGIKPLQRDFPLSLSLAGMGIKSEC